MQENKGVFGEHSVQTIPITDTTLQFLCLKYFFLKRCLLN